MRIQIISTFAAMKAKFVVWGYFCILLLCISSCRHTGYPPLLAKVDSLTNVRPDSAILLLSTLKTSIQQENEAMRMYYRLLCIKARDKAYIKHTSDSAILPVLHYYIKKNDRRHLPEAYYYAGRVYRDLGDAPQALDYFEKAVDALPEKDHSILKEKIYSQTGTLFAYQNMPEEALKMHKKGIQLSYANKDSIGLYFNLRDIGNMYKELNKPDSTIFYLKESEKISRQLHRKDLFNMIQSQLASIYTDIKQYDSARVVLHHALRDIRQSNRSSIYSIAAVFYHSTAKMDSAIYYYNKLLKCGNVYAKRDAHAVLLEVAARKQDIKQMVRHLRGYHLYTDSIQKITQTETIQRMHSLYNYQLREKENLRLKEESRQRLFLLWIIGSGLVILSLAFFAYRQYSRGKKQKLEEQIRKFRQIEAEKSRKIESLEEYKHQKEELEKKLQSANIRKNETTAIKIKQKLELINHILGQDKIESEQETEAKDELFNSDLYERLRARANSARGEAYITSGEWDTLKNLMTPAYPTFFTRLNFLHTPNENELHVCILIKLQFRPADIARLLQLKPETISSIRKRLYQKVTGEKGTSEQWDKIIHSL